MSDEDAAIGRELVKDELETTNKYERMADHADDPRVAEVVRDVADEEKVHAGEGAAIVAENDKRAVPAMKEGVKEAGGIMGFDEMLKKAIDEKDRDKGYPPMTEAKMMRDPYRHVELQVSDQCDVNGNRGEHIGSEGSVKTAEKNDGKSGAYDEDHATAKKEVPDDGKSGAYDEGKKVSKSFAEAYQEKGGFVKTNGVGILRERVKANRIPNPDYDPNKKYDPRYESNEKTIPRDSDVLRNVGRSVIHGDPSTSAENVRQFPPEKEVISDSGDVAEDRKGSNGAGMADVRSDMTAKLAN